MTATALASKMVPPRELAHPRKQRIVVVLGMHRSGTSLLTSLLAELGVDLGDNLIAGDANNEAGYWEHAEINRTQDSLLAQLRHSWPGPAWMNPFPLDWQGLAAGERLRFKQELSAMVREGISKANGIWGFKDPRTTRLLPLWKEIFSELDLEPYYILAVRNPADVAASVVKRDKVPASHAELLWLLHNLEVVREGGDPLRLVISYDRWFTNAQEQVRALTQALDLAPRATEEQLLLAVQQRIRPELRHWQTEPVFSLPLVAETWRLLEQAGATGQLPEELRQIDMAVARAFTICSSGIAMAAKNAVEKFERPNPRPPETAVISTSHESGKIAAAPLSQPKLRARLIAFYLPQFHPIEENDRWWGKGFTEWTNVGRARPLFHGHHQPRVPADLGYYDLRLPEARMAQAALAQEHGLHGFCYYHYWFHGRRLLERPFNEVLASGSPALPFCLCWANENWTRAWDGLDREVLMAQSYSPQDDLEHIRWLANAFRDPRYIRVHGKPVFLVYRVASLPNVKQTVSIWRDEARRLGLGELFLVSVESRVGSNTAAPPAQIGFDAAVEFQPDGLHFPPPIRRLNDYGGIFDYRAVVERMIQKPAAEYLRFPCVAPGWDNSPRRKENPTIITGSTPELYEHWLESVVQRHSDRPSEENLIFVNAWNEWGEGACLEPDQVSGRAYLEATKRVLLGQRAKAKFHIKRISCGPQVVPEASIIIPTFNRLDLTRRCLQSIADTKSKTTVEILVVDNASTDGTVEFFQGEAKAGRLRVVLNTENLGFAKACNQGARAATGRHILFLNNDTQVQPGWLEPLLETMEADQNVAAVGSKLLFPDRTIQHAGVVILEDRQLPDPLVARHIHYRRPEGDPGTSNACTYQALTAACLLIRKSAFEKVGGFDEEYWNGYEDVDLCFKLQQEGGLLVYQPRSVVIHFESQSGPERFRQVAHNTQRLHQKWIGKITPDYVVAVDGTISRTAANKIAAFAPMTSAPKISIIILAHDQLAHTRLCLDSIRAHTPQAHELILVDNGSTDGTSDYFRALAAQQQNVIVISNRRNLGFAAGNNQGLAVARGDGVVLLNNDTVLTEGWLERMLAALQRQPDLGIVGPMTNYVSGPQLVQGASYQSLDEMRRFADDWSRAHAGQILESPRVVGFCLLARRSVIDRIGGLDEQFGSGNFEDDDFCLRARFAGFKIGLAQDAFIHHTGSQTFKGAKIDYRASLLRNWNLFKTKWSLAKNAEMEKGYPSPSSLPVGASLRIALPDLSRTHKSSSDGRLWTATTLSVPANRPSIKATSKPKSIQLPACALLGHLGPARELLNRKQHRAAWESTLTAIQTRPYHPEAYLLLAEIAQAAGDGDSARRYAKTARDLAPSWAPPKQFLRGQLRGHAKPEWLKLPPYFGDHAGGLPPRVSICLIVRNEEQFIESCLRSVRSLASQIIVVDTGSTDRTIDLAKKCGAEVHSFAWCDDFSAARNAALEHATGDWVLILDADEELMPEQAETIGREIRAATVMGYRLPIIDRGREQDGCSYVPRLFRNAPGLFFVGRIHEQVFSSIQVRCQQWGLKHVLGKTSLLHHGYTGEVMAARHKIERNLGLLERAVEETPGEPHLIMSLGLELVRSGKLEAGLDRYWEAFRLLASLPAAEVTPELRETLLTQLTKHLFGAQRFSEIVRLWQDPFAKKGGLTASQHFSLGLAHIQLQQPAEAAEHMRQCIAVRDRPALSPINPEILKAGPHHCLALCLLAVKDAAGAQRAFDAALAADPTSRPLRFDLARLHAAQGRNGEALKILGQLATENPGEARVWELGGKIALQRPEHLTFARDWTSQAVKNFPQDPKLLDQRAEALLLNQDVAQALPLWRRAEAQSSPRQRAALVLCELLTGDLRHHFTDAEEPALSQEALQWYRQCIRMGAHGLINDLHERMEIIRLTLPSFVRACEAAHRQASKVAA